MKNFKKKLFCFALTVVMLFGLSTSVFADTPVVSEQLDSEVLVESVLDSIDADARTDVSVVNEFDHLRMLNESSDAELMQSGYTEDDIDIIRNYDKMLADCVEELAELDGEALSDMGYSSQQIDIIYNFDGSADQLRAISGSLSFTLTCDNRSYIASKNKSEARLIVTFNWTTQPLVKFTDIIGITWNGPMTRKSYSTYIQYVHMSGGGSPQNDSAQFVNPNGPVNAGAGFKFSMRGRGTSFDTHYAKSGRITVNLETQGHVNLAAYAAYGHKTYNIHGGPSLAVPGGLSISFSPSGEVEKAGQAWTLSYNI